MADGAARPAFRYFREGILSSYHPLACISVRLLLTNPSWNYLLLFRSVLCIAIAATAMPLIQIHIFRGVRTPEQIRSLVEVAHKCIREHFTAPPGDRYQVSIILFPARVNQIAPCLHRFLSKIITQHEPYELICEDTGLGIKRSEKLVAVQVLQQGRNAGQKQAFYAALAQQLEEKCDIPGEDLIVSISANSPEDWSFGNGRAQFLTGEL